MAEQQSSLLLKKQLNDLKKHPVEGFTVDLLKADDLFTWEVYVQGPPATFYEGGAFRAILHFPTDFPYTPPKMAFTSEVWHPNVYYGAEKNGEVCISILHPPGGNPDMPDQCESDRERWNPAHSVTTIILSVISLLSDPNFSSPANVDASVQWRRDIEAFKQRVKKTVDKSIKELPPGFQFPKATKHVVERPLVISSYGSDEELEDEQIGPYDSVYRELGSMGFLQEQIRAAIERLQDAGKKVHQESVMEKLLE